MGILEIAGSGVTFFMGITLAPSSGGASLALIVVSEAAFATGAATLISGLQGEKYEGFTKEVASGFAEANFKNESDQKTFIVICVAADATLKATSGNPINVLLSVKDFLTVSKDIGLSNDLDVIYEAIKSGGYIEQTIEIVNDTDLTNMDSMEITNIEVIILQEPDVIIIDNTSTTTETE